MNHPSNRLLLQTAVALLVAPFVLQAIGLTLTSSTDLVIYSMAAIGLNLLVGFTGLTSFGHGAWFGIGAYAAALAQLNWFKGSFVSPLVFAVLFIAVLATAFGFLILRRRGVYFSLLTLALSALTFTVSFRWTALTGGESGLGAHGRHPGAARRPAEARRSRARRATSAATATHTSSPAVRAAPASSSAWTSS